MTLKAVTSSKGLRGAITVSFAALLGSASMAVLAAMQDWYVDVNAPNCISGTGTQADPFCNVMDAVTVAVDGDTIHIAPGTYFENVQIDEDLTLIGTGGQVVTILDGMGSDSVIRVMDASVTLTGLTVTNGGSASVAGGGIFFSGYYPYGYPSDDSLTVEHCTITGNTAYYGGGVYIEEGTALLVNSEVVGNTALADGGGIRALSSSLEVVNSDVRGNTAEIGGGITSITTVTTIRNSSITDNSAVDSGGIDATYAVVTITNSTVTGNMAVDSGGGIGAFSGAVFPASSRINVMSSTLRGNEASHGGGIFFHPSSNSSELAITNSTVTGNGAEGIRASSYAPVTILNTTVSDHDTVGIHATVLGYPGHVALSNSILWGNGADSLVVVGAPASVDHTLIQGGWPGTGNLDADPLFVDPMSGDYRLMPNSPAIDMGDNASVPMGITHDIRGFPRFLNGIVDMGAYEYGPRLLDARRVPVPVLAPRTVR